MFFFLRLVYDELLVASVYINNYNINLPNETRGTRILSIMLFLLTINATKAKMKEKINNTKAPAKIEYPCIKEEEKKTPQHPDFSFLIFFPILGFLRPIFMICPSLQGTKRNVSRGPATDRQRYEPSTTASGLLLSSSLPTTAPETLRIVFACAPSVLSLVISATKVAPHHALVYLKT